MKDLEHNSPQIPALVVSGFLGAGKTTLVRHLLQRAQRQGIRVAVVSNEFGELGIDQALLGTDPDSGYVELEGGCVCCKLSNELLETLQTLWERVRPDRVIVETSGVALPFETLLAFWREPVSQWVGDSVAVVVVNAEQLAEERDLVGTFEQQVSSADFLLLNKVDLVPEPSLKVLEAKLENMAPGTPVIRTVDAEVEEELLFPPDPRNLKSRSVPENRESQPHVHESFEAEELVVQSGLEPEAVIAKVKEQGALRVKGFVQTSEGLRLLQGIGPRVDLVKAPVDPPTHLIGRIVVIKRNDGARFYH